METIFNLGQSNIIGSFVPFILMIIIIYFLIIRPQKKKQKNHSDMLEQLKIGDEVLTNGGIKGKIVNLKKEKGFIVLKVDNNVKISFLIKAISTVILNEKEK